MKRKYNPNMERRRKGMDPILVGGIAAGVIMVGGVVYYALRGKSGNGDPVEVELAGGGPGEAELRETGLTTGARAELCSNIRRMDGTLEAMYKLGRGHRRNQTGVFDEWTARISDMRDTPGLQAAWNGFAGGYKSWSDSDFQRKAHILMEWLLEDGRLRRDDRETLVTTEDTWDEYVNHSGGDYPGNRQAKVLSPSWKYDGKVVEKGFLQVGEDQP